MKWLTAPDREIISTPFAADVFGTRCDVVTNGLALLALPGPTWPARDNSPDLKGILKDIWSNSVTVKGVLGWSFGETEEECHQCAGKGEHEDEFGYFRCSCECGVRPTSGSVGGVVFDRRILWKFLVVANQYTPVRDVKVSWGKATEPVRFDLGNRSVVLLMPRKADVQEIEASASLEELAI